jgi:tRNA splicing endonuclease
MGNFYIPVGRMMYKGEILLNLINHSFEMQGECASGDWRLTSISELWLLLVENESFLCFYKAYHHLRIRNWIVRNGKQYGTDLIAYRHHPSQVHAEYVVIHS